MNIFEKQQQIEKIIEKYGEQIIGREARSLASELEIRTSEENRKALERLENEYKTLEIGIVGRVKAGKSSLINAIFFDGRSVLPKAATPMTAALTIISYGEKLSAEVDFFSEEDIENIREEYQKYLDEKERIYKEKYRQFKKKKILKKEEKENQSRVREKIDDIKRMVMKKELTEEEKKEIHEKAEKAAKRELESRERLAYSFDQYQRIKNSGEDIAALREHYSKISASDFHELSEELLKYVAADGEFMPFTKSVHIKIPDKKLRNIRIVDTPGISDPVRSREMKTREYLDKCDVIFIVSPAGGFLKRDDTELMDRITTKKGIRELFVVASQIDNVLYGSILRESAGDLSRALNLVISELSDHMCKTLKELKENSPEVGDTYDQLIRKRKEKIVHSSGICQTMISLWEEKDKWDSTTQTAWKNLNTHYADYFSDDNRELSLANLGKLANTNEVSDIISAVINKKELILSQRKENFLSAKERALSKYKQSLMDFIERRVQEIKETDIGELKKQREEIAKIREKGSTSLDWEYDRIIEKLEIDLEDLVNSKVEKFYEKAIDEINNNVVKKIYRKFPIFAKRKEHITIRTGAISAAIIDFESDIENKLHLEFNPS